MRCLIWQGFDNNGVPLQAVPIGYTLLSRTIILNGTTTYTVPTGTRAIFVEAIGGGGAGGGVINAATNSGAGGGGGSGAYSNLWKVAPKLTAFTVAVGAGGTGVSGATGNVGGDTTFDSGSICTAKGGAGGLVDTIAVIHVGGGGGAGGLASGGIGDLKINGATGSEGLALAAAQANSGDGGSSFYGVGGGGVKNATSVGTAGSLYGAGGSGACAISGGATQTGGAGANGVLVIWEYA